MLPDVISPEIRVMSPESYRKVARNQHPGNLFTGLVSSHQGLKNELSSTFTVFVTSRNRLKNEIYYTHCFTQLYFSLCITHDEISGKVMTLVSGEITFYSRRFDRLPFCILFIRFAKFFNIRGRPLTTNLPI